jgi:hypothetical protein
MLLFLRRHFCLVFTLHVALFLLEYALLTDHAVEVMSTVYFDSFRVMDELKETRNKDTGC